MSKSEKNYSLLKAVSVEDKLDTEWHKAQEQHKKATENLQPQKESSIALSTTSADLSSGKPTKMKIDSRLLENLNKKEKKVRENESVVNNFYDCF